MRNSKIERYGRENKRSPVLYAACEPQDHLFILVTVEIQETVFFLADLLAWAGDGRRKGWHGIKGVG